MGEKKAISVTIVNRNFPPVGGITGESAAHLAAFLRERGVHVHAVTISNASYGSKNKSATEKNVTIWGLRSFYNGKNKVLRLFASLWEGFALIRKARKVNADWTIVMTDPPLLNFFASRILKGKKRWILWSMDVYPDAFSAAGLLKDRHPIAQYLAKTIRKYPPHAVIALGPVQRCFLEQRYYPATTYFELPCGIFQAAQPSEKPDWRGEDGKIYLGYCGNLGEAHSLDFVKSVIDNLIPDKFVLVLSPYGAKAGMLKEYAEGKAGIVFVPSVNRNLLGYIDIHLASLLEDWVNICVPSKTVSSVCAGSAFLYHGIQDSDNWCLLQDAGWIVPPSSDSSQFIMNFLSDLTKDALEEKKKRAVRVADQLRGAMYSTYVSVFEEMARHSH